MEKKSPSYTSKQLDISKLRPYPRHTFKAYNEAKLNEMAESIEQYGVLSPILVRPAKDSDGEYEIIAGNNRVNAAKIAGVKKIAAQIGEMTDDEADILMVEDNITHRTKILPSEKGKSYKAYLEAHYRRGSRTDLTERNMTYGRIGHKSSRAELALLCGDSETNIRRYIDLTKLLPDLQDLVDDDKLALNAAVNLSVLSEVEQGIVLEEIRDKPSKLNISNSMILREEKLKNENTEININVIRSILNAEKDKPKKKVKSLKLSTTFLSKYFGEDELYEDDILEKLEKALNLLESTNAEV